MKYRWIAIAMACSGLCRAQTSDYLGPAIATNGASTIGQRSGQDLDMRLYGGVKGIYDNGLVPLAVDSKGNLADIGGLYGVEADIGAYGQHAWKRVRLGLDYTGTYRRYDQATTYNGLTQQLALGLTYQKSRKIVIDLQESAGTLNQGASLLGVAAGINDSVVDQSTLLFDNRATYVQSGMQLKYQASVRTTYSLGGTGYFIRRKSAALVGVNGYTLNGDVQHRQTQSLTIGASYQHTHYDFPKAFGESDVNLFTGNIAKDFGRSWTISAKGGAYIIETQGVENVSIDPAIAALLGTSTAPRAFYKKTWLPTIQGSIQRKFRRATWSANYSRGGTPGNGLYLASQQESYSTALSYTGSRKWSYSLGGIKTKLSAVAQNIAPYSSLGGYASLNYTVSRELYLVADYQLRHQEITESSFRRNSSRISVGLTYSPGDVPISFH